MFAMFALLVGDINVLLIAVINSVGAQKCKVLIICNKKNRNPFHQAKFPKLWSKIPLFWSKIPLFWSKIPLLWAKTLLL